ncbi:MAG: hypothetical protein VX589_02240 [Myxococcota bacterium]|nr:hypothetical protein [Myxococcota bacterium]
MTFYWDFYGPMSAGTAAHFKRHLDDFLHRADVESAQTGVETYTELHCAAWCTAPEATHPMIIESLRPHRGTRPADT